MDIDRMMAVMPRMITLLRAGGSDDWANRLARLQSNLHSDPSGTRYEIVTLFGGMGSLNDVVLYRDGKPLIAENDEFAQLKSDMFDACH